ncbi:Uncharacterised protein [Mycobacteroides abscessus subsp. abscessus]|nr:Uncharacterised protein [Mycobacteroides abscessus subsp. abscessus]
MSSNASTCTEYCGSPVAVSIFGLPVSKFSRGSAARVTMNRVPDVSILKRIVLSSFSCGEWEPVWVAHVHHTAPARSATR